MPEGHRWSGYSHQELYEKIHAGPGPQASFASIERWAGIADALTDIDADLHEGILRSGAHWEGTAADQARHTMNPLASWAGNAREGADTMKLSAELQADYIAKARAEMPAPVKVTAPEAGGLETFLTHLIGGQTDNEIQEKARDAAEERAREVMATYASSTSGNTATLGTFHQPPQMSVQAPAVVRNENQHVFHHGWGWGGPRGGWNGGWRGGRPGSRQGSGWTRRPVPTWTGGDTRPSWTPPSGGATTRPATGPLVPHHGPTGGPGAVIGGGTTRRGDDQDRDRDKRSSTVTTGHNDTVSSGTSSGSGSGGSGSGSGGSGSGGFGSGAGGAAAAGAGLPLPSGTTTASSAEFGAFAAANAQQSTLGPGSASGSMLGATGAQGGGDTVHKRSTPAPAQPAFDPFGVGPQAAEDEEDEVHEAADYLRETDDVYGVGGMISPAVIGESPTRR
ncbi:hypothetical protein GCM10022243_06970 [Saccharothrix violaceirubra]|uniref:PPE domain-containing protein n=1 Tax=Saccharothrix violaceirubra TaxID=413306 RepID=A0A7W7WTH2_9PSEU|nr:PPE domain-containing protein [Saccharothrix violaceirubra]MBB4963109.1 hypothetical protein [Saccharothrix violaceirubra]